jgi:ankyrin repeat protein
MTALHHAAERGDVAMVEMLVYAGANVGATTRIGQYTPLHIASQSGSAAVVRALLKAGATATARTTTTGVTPLHLAASSGNAEVVHLLLDAGADANAKDADWGQTPLIYAASLNRADAIKALVAHKADPSITTKTIDIAKQGALDSAATERQRKVLEPRRERRAADGEPGAGGDARLARRSHRHGAPPIRRKAPRLTIAAARARTRTSIRRDQSAGRDQGRPDGAAARGAAGHQRRAR